MQSIRATVNPRLLKKADRLFTGTREGRVIEILQNARRAGATRVVIDNTEDSVVTIRDNGSGIDDFTKLVDLGASSWEKQIEASEDPAGVGVFCLAPRAVTIRSRGRRITITDDGWTGAPIPIETDEPIVGTELRFNDGPWTAALIEPLAVFAGMEVIVDGHVCAKRDFVSSGAAHHAGLGCRIEVCERNGLSCWHRAPHPSSYDWNVLLNFHGQLVGFTHHPVEEHGLQFLIDMTGEPTEIRLMLPARTQIVENNAFVMLKRALEHEAFRYIQRRGHHALPYKQYQRAHELGIPLAEATPTFRVGLIGGGDSPEPIEVTKPDGFPLQQCYRISKTLLDSEEFSETNTHLLAALGTFESSFVPVAIDARYDGYSWAKLPTVERIKLVAGDELHADSVWSGRLVCMDELVLSAYTSDGEEFRSRICMAVRANPPKEGSILEYEDLLVTPEANERLLASQIWYHLGGWIEDGDTYETQEYQFEQELNRFWAAMIGSDEQLRRDLCDALLGLTESWQRVTIEHAGAVVIQLTDGTSRTIKP